MSQALQNPAPPALRAVAFRAANARAYLSAVFAAYAAGEVVMVLPRAADLPDLPGVALTGERSFEDDWGWFDEAHAPIASDAPAQIAFSSGTTGTPKAILLSHRALADVVGRINAAMEVDDTIREYIGVPVTFSFGLGRARAVAAAGGRSYLPQNGFDPVEIAAMLEAGEINAVSAVPTLWRVVLADPGALAAAGPRVRWIEIGSQYMSAEEKAQMRALFPNARIVQHYGLTEASRSTLLDISGAPADRLESVGRAEGATAIAIDPETGAIRVRGPHVAEGLVTADGVVPLADGAGWLTTSDRGRIEDGWLYYGGRLDELINVGGIKVDPTRFEERLVRRLGRPDDIAVARAADPLRGERVLVAWREGSGLSRTQVAPAAEAVGAELGLQGAGALMLREVASIPRTATGKVRRAALAEAARPTGAGSAAAEPEAAASAAGLDSPQARAALLRRVWGRALGMGAEVPLHESFYDLGGDSLSALTVILRLQSEGLDAATARRIFDGATIAQIAGLPDAPAVTAGPAADPPRAGGLTLAQAMRAIHMTRGLLALWVVVIHWLPGVLQRLPGAPMWIWDALQPVLRFGTPGFAIVFGLGVGALGLAQYRRSPEQFRAGNRLKFRLVLAGVAVLALMTGALRLARGDLIDTNTPSAMFYSAISYYALALLALPLFLAFLSRARQPLIAILACAVGAMAITAILSATVMPLRPGGVLELIKILAGAKYGFFRMSGYVLMGVALGYLYRRHHGDPDLARALALAGAALMAMGLVIGHAARPGEIFADVGRVLPWHLVIYVGAAVLILAGFTRLARPGRQSAPVGAGLTFLAASGILALPIFVGHELVLPANTLLGELGVPGAIAVAVPLAIFLVLMALAYRRMLPMVTRPD